MRWGYRFERDGNFGVFGGQQGIELMEGRGKIARSRRTSRQNLKFEVVFNNVGSELGKGRMKLEQGRAGVVVVEGK